MRRSDTKLGSRHKGPNPSPRRRGHRPLRSGASVVEFAVVAPFLFMLLIGMLEFSRVLSVHNVMTTAARVGAREAILPGATTESVTEAVQAVTEAATFAVDNVQVSCSSDPASTSCGTSMTVSVNAPMSSISKLGSYWFGSTHNVTARAVMRKEGID